MTDQAVVDWRFLGGGDRLDEDTPIAGGGTTTAPAAEQNGATCSTAGASGWAMLGSAATTRPTSQLFPGQAPQM